MKNYLISTNQSWPSPCLKEEKNQKKKTCTLIDFQRKWYFCSLHISLAELFHLSLWSHYLCNRIANQGLLLQWCYCEITAKIIMNKYSFIFVNNIIFMISWSSLLLAVRYKQSWLTSLWVITYVIGRINIPFSCGQGVLKCWFLLEAVLNCSCNCCLLLAVVKFRDQKMWGEDAGNYEHRV